MQYWEMKYCNILVYFLTPDEVCNTEARDLRYQLFTEIPYADIVKNTLFPIPKLTDTNTCNRLAKDTLLVLSQSFIFFIRDVL